LRQFRAGIVRKPAYLGSRDVVEKCFWDRLIERKVAS